MVNSIDSKFSITKNFITNLIDKEKIKSPDLKVITRFPPEPNGYLHIGHLQSIWLNYRLAKVYAGKFILRFDDTNPSTAQSDFYQSIIHDLQWLEIIPDQITYASDYFQQLYEFAYSLIDQSLAYVCDLSINESKEYKGNRYNLGKESPYRNRSISDNRILFSDMIQGKKIATLRAKIDMSSANIDLRDPVLYRHCDHPHPRTGNTHYIYPSYAFTHPLCDALEQIPFSICTQEFDNQVDFYNWLIANCNTFRSKQISCSKFELEGVVISKRNIRNFIEEQNLGSWDHPSLYTIGGLRNRGLRASDLTSFFSTMTVSKQLKKLEYSIFKNHLRKALQADLPRRLAVKSPLMITIDDMPVNSVDINCPIEQKTRTVSISNVIFIESNDFVEGSLQAGEKKLTLNGNIRLLFTPYVIQCYGVQRDAMGNITGLLGKINDQSAQIDANIHWVDSNAYQKLSLFKGEFLLAELGDIPARVQFVRLGYYYRNSLQWIDIIAI